MSEISQDLGIEVYECQFEPADLDAPLTEDDLAALDALGIEAAPKPKIKVKPDDPLDALGVLRDPYGRPMILPDPAWRLAPATWPDRRMVKGQHADGRRPMTRVSTACGWNDLGYGLNVWRARMIKLALARRPDIQARLCAMTYASGSAIDALDGELFAGLRALDGIDIDGELTAAGRGTAFHEMTVPGAPPLDPVYGEHLAPFAITVRALDEAYERAGLVPIEHEQFGVDYARNLGGRLDHLVEVVHSRKIDADPGTVLCLDKKTGKDQHWITFATQIGMYSRLRPHDWKTGETGPGWHSQLDPDNGLVVAASLKTGIVKIYPIKTPTYLVDSAIERYRNSLAEHVKSLVGKGI